MCYFIAIDIETSCAFGGRQREGSAELTETSKNKRGFVHNNGAKTGGAPTDAHRPRRIRPSRWGGWIAWGRLLPCGPCRERPVHGRMSAMGAWERRGGGALDRPPLRLPAPGRHSGDPGRGFPAVFSPNGRFFLQNSPKREILSLYKCRNLDYA